jgi:hypothetical protein
MVLDRYEMNQYQVLYENSRSPSLLVVPIPGSIQVRSAFLGTKKIESRETSRLPSESSIPEKVYKRTYFQNFYFSSLLHRSDVYLLSWKRPL